MLFASIGIFGVFLFLTYYLQGTLGYSPVKTGIAFLPLVAALATMAQVSNRVLLPRFGPKPIVPVGLLICAVALFGLHLVGLHSSYASHVLPYLLVLGIGFGLSVSPAFSTGTLGLVPQDAGVGLGDAQHGPTGRGIDRNGSAQHAGGRVPPRLTWSVGRRPPPMSRPPCSTATRRRSCGPP